MRLSPPEAHLNRATYNASAKPFSDTVIDNFLPGKYADLLVANFRDRHFDAWKARGGSSHEKMAETKVSIAHSVRSA